MELTTKWAIFGVGCLGGFFAEFVSLWALRKDPVLPAYLKSVKYYILSGGMIGAGGGLAVLYGVHMSAFLALNIGASAPLLVQRLFSAVPPEPTAKVSPDARIN